MYHNPVLLSDSVGGLLTDRSGCYVDVTFGGGGHSREILSRLSAEGRLIAFDQDPEAAANCPDDDRFQFVPQNFRHLKKWLSFYKAIPVSGILADLGVSSHQFDTPERGFSYRFNGVLDMRMNPARGLSAADLVNEYPEEKLAHLFFQYGELPNAKRLAAAIVTARTQKRLATTEDLVNAVSAQLPHGKENKMLAQIFQALRIEVNGEMDVLREFLTQSAETLQSGGRLVVISYHSLEDRLVKNFMRAGNFEGIVEKDFYGNPLSPYRLVTRKAIQPGEEEVAENPRARSAKLRIAEKI